MVLVSIAFDVSFFLLFLSFCLERLNKIYKLWRGFVEYTHGSRGGILPLPSQGSRHDRKNQELIDALFEDNGKIKLTLSQATHDSFKIIW